MVVVLVLGQELYGNQIILVIVNVLLALHKLEKGIILELVWHFILIILLMLQLIWLKGCELIEMAT